MSPLVPHGRRVAAALQSSFNICTFALGWRGAEEQPRHATPPRVRASARAVFLPVPTRDAGAPFEQTPQISSGVWLDGSPPDGGRGASDGSARGVVCGGGTSAHPATFELIALREPDRRGIVMKQMKVGSRPVRVRARRARVWTTAGRWTRRGSKYLLSPPCSVAVLIFLRSLIFTPVRTATLVWCFARGAPRPKFTYVPPSFEVY